MENIKWKLRLMIVIGGIAIVGLFQNCGDSEESKKASVKKCVSTSGRTECASSVTPTPGVTPGVTPGATPGATPADNRIVAYCGEYRSASDVYHPTADDMLIYPSGCYGVGEDTVALFEAHKAQVRTNWSVGTSEYCKFNSGYPYLAHPAYFHVFKKTQSGRKVESFYEEDPIDDCP